MQLCETKLELSERESRGRPYNRKWYVQICSSYNVTRDVAVVVNDDCLQWRLDVMQTDVDAVERLWSRVE